MRQKQIQHANYNPSHFTHGQYLLETYKTTRALLRGKKKLVGEGFKSPDAPRFTNSLCSAQNQIPTSKQLPATMQTSPALASITTSVYGADLVDSLFQYLAPEFTAKQSHGSNRPAEISCANSRFVHGRNDVKAGDARMLL